MSAKPSASLRPRHRLSRPLSELVRHFGLSSRSRLDGLEITGVCADSRVVEPGDLYVGMPGEKAHGAAFAAAAADAGAVAILTDAAGAGLASGSGLPAITVEPVREALGPVASWVYRTAENPATLYGVTGTNGKTSVVYLLCAILDQLGVTAGLSSTVERRIGSESVVSALTTPEASELHALLARMREDDVRGIAVEVSAQALSRNRVDGLVFDVAGFTNLSHDHLDDYRDLEEYFSAKLELFGPDRAVRGVVAVDSDWGRRLAETARIPVVTLSSVPDVEAEWRVSVTDAGLSSTAFTLEGPDGRGLSTRVPLLGDYMAFNAALAIVMIVASGYDLDVVAQALDRDGGIDVRIPGRAERISGPEGPVVFMDYGHTPDAFAQTLAAIRRVTDGRILMVFGADGDRDTTKRTDMGAIAARGADTVIVTDFNPRFEDPAAIRAALLAGAREAVPDGDIREIADPAEAFRAALALATEDDVILYAGPGHEDFQHRAGAHVPYSAREDSREALHEAGWPT